MNIYNIFGYIYGKNLLFLVYACIASDLFVSIFSFLFLIFNFAMKQCPLQPKLLIDWNSAVLCFTFHIGVWTLARFVRPLQTTIRCVWGIWSGSNNRIMYHVFHRLTKKMILKKLKNASPTDFEADLETEYFFWGLVTVCPVPWD